MPTITEALIERTAAIVYNELHKQGYSNTWNTAHDKALYRQALAKALAEIQR